MTNPSPHARLDDFFDTLCALRPVDASFLGRHQYDGTLPDFSDDGIALHRNEIDRLAEAFPLDETPGPLDPDEMDRRVAAGYLASQQALFASDHSPARDPSVLTGLAVLGIIGLLRRDFAPDRDRIASAMKRIDALPDLLAQADAAARSAPGSWSTTALPQCAAGARLCRTGIRQFCEERGLALPDPDACEAAALAFDRLAVTLRAAETGDDRHPGCGSDLLDLLLETTHHIAGGSATVEGIALAEMQAATARLEEMAADLGGDWRTTLAQTQAELVPEAKVMARHRDIFDAHRALVAEHRLLTWPDYPLTFRPVPGWLRDTMGDAGVYPYHAAAPRDPDVPVDFIVPDAPGGTPDITIMSNHVLHHAGVGHHVQNWFAYTLAETRFGRVSAVDSAGYIFILSGIGMAEGWSGYVPGMISEFGIADARQSLCIAFDRLRSASRGVVDVRLHSGAWSVAEAAEYLVRETGASPQAARAAVRRIGHTPGSGSMYCTGPAIVRHLREMCVGQDAAPGALGRFHDSFLSYGSLPLPIIAEAMTGMTADAFIRTMPRATARV